MRHAWGPGSVQHDLRRRAPRCGDALRALALGLALAALAGLALVIRHGGVAWRTSLPLAPFIVSGALLTVIA